MAPILFGTKEGFIHDVFVEIGKQSRIKASPDFQSFLTAGGLVR